MADAFCVHLTDGRTVKFRICSKGLHCLDPNEDTMTLANTIAEVRKHHSERQCQWALKAQELLLASWFLSVATLRNTARTPTTNHCPATLEDTKVAEHLFGEDVFCLQGKTV